MRILLHSPKRRVHPKYTAEASALTDCGNRRLVWWRRRELNPRPKMLLVKRLHAYSRSCPRHYPGTFATPAQNGQETVAASLMISSSLLRRGREDQPSV